MINKHKSNKIKENSNTVRHLNNGTDHRHSKSCCDQSSPARRTTTPMESHKIVSFYNNMICCTDRLIRSFLVHQNNSPWYHGFWCPGDRASAGMVLTLCIWREIEMICRIRCQAIIWTSAGILLIGPLGTNFSEFLIEIHTFLFKKMHLKISSVKWGLFRRGPNVLAMMLRCNNVLCTW